MYENNYCLITYRLCVKITITGNAQLFHSTYIPEPLFKMLKQKKLCEAKDQKYIWLPQYTGFKQASITGLIFQNISSKCSNRENCVRDQTRNIFGYHRKLSLNRHQQFEDISQNTTRLIKIRIQSLFLKKKNSKFSLILFNCRKYLM